MAKPRNADLLEVQVWNEMLEYLSNADLIRSTLENHEQSLQQEQKKDDSDLESLYSAEQAIKREEDRLLDAYTAGVIELSQLQEKLALTKKRHDAINAEKAEINKRAAKRSISKADLEVVTELCQRVQQGLNAFTVQDRRRVLDALNIRVLVSENNVRIIGVISDAFA